MRLILSILFSIAFVGNFNSQSIYSKSYGDKSNPAIIFIHGGPSGNSNLFEGTTAQKLADRGFYVIVYDRRGEGRSTDPNATMTFEESFEDLNNIYKLYHIKKANLLGHSFGGIIATLYSNKYPSKVNSLILAGALFSQQETYDHILQNAKIFVNNNPSKLGQIGNIERLNKRSAEYRKEVFAIADELHYFEMPNPTTESTQIRQDFAKSDFSKTSYRNPNSPLIFYKNEKQNNISTKNILQKILNKKIPVYAIYGENDGIFSKKQLTELQNLIGAKNFQTLPNCSHFLFVDQQNQFLDFLSEKVK